MLNPYIHSAGNQDQLGSGEDGCGDANDLRTWMHEERPFGFPRLKRRKLSKA